MSPRGRFGHPRVHRRVTASTNEVARQLAAAGAPHGTAVTASEQTAGRGRQGRVWTAPPRRALLLSVVVRELSERHALLPLAAAVAVSEACERAADGVRCQIKWPNDVWVERRKLAGILVEGRPQDGWAVIGIGVNVSTAADGFPADLRPTATSLAIAAGGRAPASPDVLLEPLLDALAARLGDEPAEVLAAWRARDALRGEPVRWDRGEGVAAGIAETGGLIVRTSDGTLELDAGEVHLLRG